MATSGDVPRKYSLAHISNELLGIDLDKNEDIRCNFGDVQRYPLQEYPNRFSNTERQTFSLPTIAFIRLRLEISKLNTNTNLSHHIQLLGALALNGCTKMELGLMKKKLLHY